MNKTLILNIVGLCLVCSLLTGIIVYASVPTNIMTLGGGNYPGGPSFTVDLDGSTIYAKNSYGTITSYDSDASTVIQECIDDSDCFSVYVKAGTYELETGVVIDKRIVFYGDGEGTIFNIAEEITGFNVTDQATLRDFRVNTIDNYESEDLTTIGICMFQIADFRIDNVYCTRVGIGLYLDRCNGGDIDHYKTYNCYHSLWSDGDESIWGDMSAYMNQWVTFTGSKLEHSRGRPFYCNLGAYISFYGCYFGSGFHPIMLKSFKNLLFDQCSFENSAYQVDDNLIETDFDDSDYRVKLIIKNGAFDCYGLALQHNYGITAYNVTGLTIEDVTIANIYSGYYFLNVSECNQVELIRPRLYNLEGDLINGESVYYYYERTEGTETIASDTTVAFNHYLEDTPTRVWVSWETEGYDDWGWSADETEITITVTNSGDYNFTWVAEYNPLTDYAGGAS